MRVSNLGQLKTTYRFEVKDEDGNFIKGATIEFLDGNTGKTVWTTVTDPGGNATIDHEAMVNKLTMATTADGIPTKFINYRVSAPGKLPYQHVLNMFPVEVTEVVLRSSLSIMGMEIDLRWLYGGVGILVAGLAIWKLRK
jgi:hypothetical protein